jgi:RNA polymerase sigma-70 factor (ECF subfamily)
MPHVPKNMAATAPAISLPLKRREKGDEERELVRLAQGGDERAFEQLVRRHQQKVFGLVARILHRQDDVEDIAQQVFLKVYLSLSRFDQRAAFSTWLYKITVNECWDHLRKKKVRPLVYEADLSEEQVSRLDGIATLDRPVDGLDDRAETRQMLDWVLEVLPERDRELLLLKEVEGFSVQELAEILNLNVNTVKVKLFRARGRVIEVHRRRAGAEALRASSAAAERNREHNG